jgi:hypothetical protein
MLIARVRANLPYALQSVEETLDTLFATLTSEPLITDDFERDGLKHR